MGQASSVPVEAQRPGRSGDPLLLSSDLYPQLSSLGRGPLRFLPVLASWDEDIHIFL